MRAGPRHNGSLAKVSAAHVELVQRMVDARGGAPTARSLKIAIATIDRVLGPGTISTAAADRLARRLTEVAAS